MDPVVTDPGEASVRLVVDGVETRAHVDDHLVEATLLPALAAAAARPRRHRRAFVFLVGPPGSGKSTLARLLADAAGRAEPRPLDVDVVGIDGFHHPNSHLAAHHLDTPDGPVPLSSIKGAPETFDVDSLARHLEESADGEVVWPVYDRQLHDVVPGTAPVSADLVLVEGNWLLLDEPGWRDLVARAAYVIYVSADADLLRDRLIRRKVRGGLSPAEATAFYERSDRRNVERVTGRSDLTAVDLALRVHADGSITPDTIPPAPAPHGTTQQGEIR